MSANQSLLARRNVAVARGIASAFPVFALRAENATLWDVDDRRYIDFGGGIAVVNTGHRHPRVVAAVREQLDRYTHTAFQIIPYEPYVAVCERLNAIAPFPGPAKSLLFSTGAEAVENAVKIARAHTRRQGIVAFAGGFHGRTNLAMALTGKVAPYRRKFGISPPGIYHLPFPAESRGVETADTLRALDTLLRSDIDAEDVAAFIIEPVQGEGGFIEAPADLLSALREIADRHGIVLIADEVQTGFGRTGRMFAIEHSGVAPDLVTVAKALAGGLPLSGVVGRENIMDAPEPGSLGGTYAGNPLACAAALATLNIIKDENLCARADSIGERIRTALTGAARRNDIVPIAGIRGRGAMIGFDVVAADGSPDPDTTRRVLTAALADGLVLLSCGMHGNTIRLLSPLTIPDDELDEGLVRLERALIAAKS